MNYIDILNLDERKLKELLIENFVVYFGEKHRKRITDKITNTDIYYLIKPTDFNNLIFNITKQIEQNYIDKTINNFDSKEKNKEQYRNQLKEITTYLLDSEEIKRRKRTLERNYTNKLITKTKNKSDERFLQINDNPNYIQLRYLEESKLLNLYKNYYNKYLSDLIYSDKYFNKLFSIISKRKQECDKLVKRDLYETILNENRAVSTSYIKENKLMNEVYIHALNISFKFDLEQTLYHEFIHGIGRNLLDISKNDYYVGVGFDESWQHYNQDERNFYALNEILTDFVASDMIKEMRKQNKQIYDIPIKEEFISYKYYGNDLLIDFYNTYKEEIKNSLITGDKSYIVNKIGYDNLLKIGKLANKYMKVSYFIEHKYFYYMKPESLENDEKEELIGEMKKVLKNIKRS